jgi:hypothetical protein
VTYPKAQADIAAKVGPTGCFDHAQPMPCDACAADAAAHPWLGACFDCKREYAADFEPGEPCSCFNGCRVRLEKGSK